ncbi:MAG: hypothetical protein WB711_04985 [Terriglobales bacterium]
MISLSFHIISDGGKQQVTSLLQTRDAFLGRVARTSAFIFIPEGAPFKLRLGGVSIAR